MKLVKILLTLLSFGLIQPSAEAKQAARVQKLAASCKFHFSFDKEGYQPEVWLYLESSSGEILVDKLKVNAAGALVASSDRSSKILQSGIIGRLSPDVTSKFFSYCNGNSGAKLPNISLSSVRQGLRVFLTEESPSDVNLNLTVASYFVGAEVVARSSVHPDYVVENDSSGR